MTIDWEKRCERFERDLAELEAQNDRIRRQWQDEVNELLEQRDEWRARYENQCVGTHSRFTRIRDLEAEAAGWKKHLDEARQIARDSLNWSFADRVAAREKHPWLVE